MPSVQALVRLTAALDCSLVDLLASSAPCSGYYGQRPTHHAGTTRDPGSQTSVHQGVGSTAARLCAEREGEAT